MLIHFDQHSHYAEALVGTSMDNEPVENFNSRLKPSIESIKSLLEQWEHERILNTSSSVMIGALHRTMLPIIQDALDEEVDKVYNHKKDGQTHKPRWIMDNELAPGCPKHAGFAPIPAEEMVFRFIERGGDLTVPVTHKHDQAPSPNDPCPQFRDRINVEIDDWLLGNHPHTDVHNPEFRGRYARDIYLLDLQQTLQYANLQQ